jgi:hypothetical protein
MVKPFIPQFPEEVANCRSFAASELHEAFPFVHRLLVSALSHDFRASHRLEGAERLPLPFFREAQVWRFRFEPVEKSSDGPKPVEAFAFEVSGTLVPVDFTDAGFAAAMAGNQALPNVDSDALKQAFLAVYFATSRRAREQDSFHPSFRSMACPEGVDAEKWKTAQEEASRMAAELGQEDLYLRLDRRAGKVVVFQHGYRPVSLFGALVPAEIDQRTILDEPALIVEPAPILFTWGSTPDPLLTLSSAGRRAERNKDAEIAKREHRRWQPEGMAEGAPPDTAAITTNAQALHAERRQRFPWVQIFPRVAEEEAERSRLAAEANELFLAINDRCEDYTIPREYLAGAVPAGFKVESEITVHRRILPFYPGHRLYKILDRRGGRPRHTQILFAPREAELPEELDRLITLNDVSSTLHMLNSAYKLHLAGIDALEYLDFFCDTVSGEYGAFHVIETVDDVRWRGQAPAQRKIVEEVVTPIRLWPAKDADPMVLDAVLTYAGTLFHAEFKVHSHGMVDMVNDHPLCERLEIAPELFSTRTHFFLRPPRDFVAPPKWLARALGQ